MAEPKAPSPAVGAGTNAQPKPIVLDDSSNWPVKPKSVDSWDTPSGQSCLFYLTGNQEHPTHQVAPTGHATSIASEAIAQWVANGSPHSTIEDNGAAYEALVEVYGVLMDTSMEFKARMIQRATEKENGRAPEAIDELHAAWVRSQEKRVDEHLGHLSEQKYTNPMPETLDFQPPHPEPKVTMGLGESGTKTAANLEQPNLEHTIDAEVLNCKERESGLRDCSATTNVGTIRKSSEQETGANRQPMYLNSDKSGKVQMSSKENLAFPSAMIDKVILVAASGSTKQALKAKGFNVQELTATDLPEGPLYALQRAAAMDTTSAANNDASAYGTPKSPIIVISGNGNTINVTCPSIAKSLSTQPSPAVAVKSDDEEVTPENIALPASIPSQPSSNSGNARSTKSVNMNATCASLSNTNTSTSSSRTLRRRQDCSNLSLVASAASETGEAPPFPHETSSPKQHTSAHAQVPIQGPNLASTASSIPNLPARMRNASPTKAQANGNTTDPIKRHSTRAPPPPPIHTASSGFHKAASIKQAEKAEFSPEYAVESSPRMLKSPQTPDMNAFPSLLTRTQASLVNAATTAPPALPTMTPIRTGIAAAANYAVRDGSPSLGTLRGRYLDALRERVASLETDKARANSKIWDDGRKIELLEAEMEGLKARLTWYEGEWRRLAGVGRGQHGQQQRGRDDDDNMGGDGDLDMGGRMQGFGGAPLW